MEKAFKTAINFIICDEIFTYRNAPKKYVLSLVMDILMLKIVFCNGDHALIVVRQI